MLLTIIINWNVFFALICNMDATKHLMVSINKQSKKTMIVTSEAILSSSLEKSIYLDKLVQQHWGNRNKSPIWNMIIKNAWKKVFKSVVDIPQSHKIIWNAEEMSPLTAKVSGTLLLLKRLPSGDIGFEHVLCELTDSLYSMLSNRLWHDRPTSLREDVIDTSCVPQRRRMEDEDTKDMCIIMM